MAIKGKKRSRQRGSQGARRPAQAPRPTASARRTRRAWYRTPLGIGMIAIFGLVALGLIIWAIGSAREETRKLEEEQTALNNYTDQIKEVLRPANDTVSEMTAVAQLDDATLETLTKDAQGWATSIQEVQTSVSQVLPSSEVEAVNELFNEALSLYATAATTLAEIPNVQPEETQERMFIQASTVRDTASAVMRSAVDVLDQLREEAELGASGVTVPGGPTAQPMPEPTEGSETIEIPTDQGDGQGGGGGNEGDAGDDDGGG